ncbi:MAG TPA: GreA/GreB family elongation factor [Herpetosiphonaceae bacterium]|nr:GreA/GreB family elongation factor [Herpetosiphonaceae bacterium]
MKTDIEYMTEEGLARLKAQLAGCRAQLAALQAARQNVAETGGDAWHDNFAFEQLEVQERGLHRMMLDLSRRIRQARLIEAPTDDTETVHRGCTVSVRFGDEAEVETYRILGSADSNPRAGIISDQSPLGAALLGARVGEVRMFQVNGTKTIVSVLSISNTEG